MLIYEAEINEGAIVRFSVDCGVIKICDRQLENVAKDFIWEGGDCGLGLLRLERSEGAKRRAARHS